MTHPAPTGLAAEAPPAPPAPASPAPAPVEVGPGRGGLERVLVRTPTASAEVYLQGAHLTAWAPAGQPTVVWTGERSAFAPGAAIRGGVPVCFPWFGPDPSGTGPLHGPVRLRPWAFTGWTRAGDDVVLTFDLASADAPTRRPPGPCATRSPSAPASSWRSRSRTPGPSRCGSRRPCTPTSP